MLTKSEAKALASKIESGQRISSVEQSSLAEFALHAGNDWSTEAAFYSGVARVNASIKAAVNKGVQPGITAIEPGKLIPPPPSNDPFHGRVCLAVGMKKHKLGQPRICGRQAVAVIRTFHPEVPDNKPLEAQAADLEARFAMQNYMGANGRIPAGGGPAVGRLVPNPTDPPSGDNERWVCFWHGPAGHTELLHPEDGGKIPEPPRPEAPLFGLGHLDPSRPFRAVGQDASYVWATDGKVTVMAHRRDYIALLAKYNLLPSDSLRLLP